MKRLTSIRDRFRPIDHLSGVPGAHLIIALGTLLLSLLSSEARPWRPDQLPNGNVFGCANCHNSANGGDARNAFGRAVEQLVSPGGDEEFWSSALAALDSDGDGFSNGTELRDPDGDGTPVSTSGVTNPGNATSKPATTAPTIVISEPEDGAILAAPAEVTIAANVSIEAGTVTMVEFFDGTTFLGTDHDSPFSVTVTLAAGQHVLTAKATAADGQTATSGEVTVTATAGPLPIDDPYPPIAKTDITIELQPIAEGLISPLGLGAPNDGTGRLFVYDQAGLVHVIANGTKLEEPLLDVRSRLVELRPGYDERGLLGMALHPDFAQNGLLYTYTSEPTDGPADFPITPNEGTTNNHQSVIAEWKIDPANSNRVDMSSRREVLRFDQPQSNHNGGTMHFGPDGMLYISTGDGGAADDQGSGHSPGGNGQDLTKILGKILRINVNTRNSANQQYGIPSDNPFATSEGADEIYAFGFRNPYTWSFDKLTGEMYVADVGQNEIEEVDLVFRGGNYGWPVKEGTFYFHNNGTEDGFIASEPATEVPQNLIDPIAEYDHSEGLAILSGFVYRGTAIPALIGRYVAGDFGTFSDPAGRIFYLDRSDFRELRIGLDDREVGFWMKGFGQDVGGEIYVFASSERGPSGTGGRMFKIVPPTNNLTIAEITRDGTNAMLEWAGGVGPFLVEAKSTVADPFCRTVLGTAERTASVPLEGRSGIYQVTDMAGIPAVGFTAHLTGAAERPNPVTTEANGTATLSLEGNTLHFDIQYGGLSGAATAAHIHGPASASEAAGVMIDLAPYNGGAFGISGTFSGSITLTPVQKAAILAGRTYINVHTAANGGGEIRGQIAPVVFMAHLTGAAERPNPVETDASGLAVFLLAGNQLTFDLNYGGLSGPATAAHIHGPASLSMAAGVMVNLAPYNGGAFGAAGAMSGTITLTPEQLAALLDGLTYVNIHTAANGGGEIRGQILPQPGAVPFSSRLSGEAERPNPVSTTGSGTGTLALVGNTLHFNIDYGDLTAAATAAHIHGPAGAGEAAGVMINFAPFTGSGFDTNGTIAGHVTLTDAQRAELLHGRTYINVHSGTHTGGEIRGQIVPSLLRVTMLGASERPNAVHVPARGRGTLVLSGNQLRINATYSGLSGAATAAHIHGPASSSGAGPVMVNLAPVNGGSFGQSGIFSGTVELTAEQLAALVDGLTYINIHTEANGGGEIRGQILR